MQLPDALLRKFRCPRCGAKGFTRERRRAPDAKTGRRPRRAWLCRGRERHRFAGASAIARANIKAGMKLLDSRVIAEKPIIRTHERVRRVRGFVDVFRSR
jgi:hypothetical protein